MIRLGVIFNESKISGKLTRFFTGCYAYHAVWVDEEKGCMYDMHLIRRRRKWPHYKPEQVVLFPSPCPGVTREFLEEQLSSDENRYGVIDYCLFSLRWLYHLFGKSTPNAGGVICSEMVNLDILACGGKTPWALGAAPPSPCDLFRWLKA